MSAVIVPFPARPGRVNRGQRFQCLMCKTSVEAPAGMTPTDAILHMTRLGWSRVLGIGTPQVCTSCSNPNGGRAA